MKSQAKQGRMNGGRRMTLLVACLVVAASINPAMSGELSTEDPHLVGYVSDTITLPCEHTVAETDLLTVYWTKDIVKVVAEYEKGDDIPVRFHDSMEGRVNAEVFPPTLKFSRCSLKDAGVYQCTVIPVKGDPITLHYTLAVNAKPSNETVCLNGQSYQNCEEVYLSESTDALLSLSCTASSKPGSRLSWTADPATPALVVNQTTEAACKTEPNGIVMCDRNATIVTKDLKDKVQVTCVTHYDDSQTVVTSKRACVVLVPRLHGPWVTVVVTLVVLWVVGVVVVLIFIFLIRRLEKKKDRAAPVNWRHLALGLGLVLLLPVIGVAVFIFLTFYWKLLPVPGKKAETEMSGEKLEERNGLRDTNPDKEGQSADKEGETAAPENNRDEQLMNSDLIMVGSK